MPLKIQLATTDQVITCNPDPEGLDNFELELKRSLTHDGVFYNFGVNLKFFKEARRLIRDIYERDGIDGKIDCRIFEYNPNSYKNEKIYVGQLRLQDYEIDQIGVEVNVEEDGAEREFINKLEVDRVIPTSASITVPPKTILQRLKAVPSTSDIFTQPSIITFNFSSNTAGQSRSATRYIMIEAQDREFAEFDSLNEAGLSYVISEFDALQFLEVLPEEQGVYDFDFTVRNGFQIRGILLLGNDVDVGASSTHTPPFTLALYFERRDKANNVIEKTQMGTVYDSAAAGDFGNNDVSVPFETRTYSAQDVQVNTGDRIYLYYELVLGSTDFDVAGQPAAVQYDLDINADVGGTFNDWNIEVNAKTQFPESLVSSVFPYELFESLVSQNSAGNIIFKSQFLSKLNDADYDADKGESIAALLAITNGYKLRQDNDKKLFANFKDVFNSLNSMFCLGWGFEFDEETGTKYIRIEKKEYFFDKSASSITITKSDGLVKRANKELYYTRVECGYPEYENLGASNATDEYNTQRRYASEISQADNVLELFSDLRASCYEIESQRRQEASTEKSKLDDKNFIIAMRRSGVDNSLFVETGANYSYVNNIFDPDTAFNLNITPSTFIENWKPILAATTLRKSNKVFEFTYGSGNYNLDVFGQGVEDRDIVMQNSDAIYYCEEYEFESGLTSFERKLITSNPRQMVTVFDWTGQELRGFLLSKKTVLEEKKATFILLRANVKIFKSKTLN